jgi:hypothetical protein
VIARTVLFVSAVCLVGTAFGQSKNAATGNGEVDIQSALATLSQQSQLYLVLQGQVTTASATYPIYCYDSLNLSVTNSSVSLMQNELLEYYNNAKVGRVVADGTTAWNYNYDLLNRTGIGEYSAGTYGSYQNTLPANYLGSGLHSMYGFANSYGSMCVKLLHQTYGDGPNVVSQYESWAPGITPVEQNNPSPSDPNAVDVTYTVGSNGQRVITFHLTTDQSTGLLELVSIQYSDSNSAKGQTRSVFWTLTPYTTQQGTAPDFSPNTAAEMVGWRAVALKAG